jgi:hypothetical protein
MLPCCETPRLGDTELPRDDRDDLTRSVLAFAELEDAPPNEIAENVERVHHDPMYSAMVRSALARASSGSSPDAACATPQASGAPPEVGARSRDVDAILKEHGFELPLRARLIRSPKKEVPRRAGVRG